jgi:putative Mn2+ efflux pump MntP
MTNVNRWLNGLSSRIQTTETNLPFHLFCLVLGFFLGNLFGTFLAALRQYISSDIVIIFVLCLFFEYISAQAYKLPVRSLQKNWRWLSRRALNLVKLGCLFGFFVDAFKVGS